MSTGTPEVLCEEKHTPVDVPGEEFVCPQCKAPCGEFYVDESPNDDCTKLHPDDLLFCSKCKFTISGATFARAYMKKHDLVPCPTCKGHGNVSSKVAAKIAGKPVKKGKK